MTCFKGLSPRTITPNEYQKNDQNLASQLHYELLSKLLHNDNANQDENSASIKNHFVVQTLMVNQNNSVGQLAANNDGKENASAKLSKCSKKHSSDHCDKSNNDNNIPTILDESAKVSKSMSEKSVQTNFTVLSSTMTTSDYSETTDDNNYRCVDLRSMTKLRKICFILRSNVIELKNVYKTRLKLGYTYAESEKSDLDLGLQYLEDEVLQLTDKLNDAKGYSVEIIKIVNKYNDLESQYRNLRSLNKRGILRSKSDYSETCSASNKNDRFNLCVMINKYVCQPCYRLFKKMHKNEYIRSDYKS